MKPARWCTSLAEAKKIARTAQKATRWVRASEANRIRSWCEGELEVLAGAPVLERLCDAGVEAKEALLEAQRIDWASANARYAAQRAKDTEGALAKLNNEQCRAAVAADERNIIIAGAGTGKTRTLVALVADHVARGEAKAHQIAFVTFTVKAAGEIRERIRDALGTQAAQAMTIGTLHHLARQILTRSTGASRRLDPRCENAREMLTWAGRTLAECVTEAPELCECVARVARMGTDEAQSAIALPTGGATHDEALERMAHALWRMGLSVEAGRSRRRTDQRDGGAHPAGGT